MDSSFSIVEILETSWDIIRRNFLVIVGYSVMAFVSVALVQFAATFLISQAGFIGFIAMFVVLVVNSVATLGFYKLIFHLIDHEEEDVAVSSVIPSWRNISSFITLTLLLGFIVVTFNLIYQQLLNVESFKNFVDSIKDNNLALQGLAVLAFILLMLIAMRFMFFPCFIVDDDSSAFESLRQSRQLSKDNILRIATVLMIIIGFIVLGFLAIGVGIIVTYPFTNIILVVTYRKLVNAYIDEHPEENTKETEDGI